MAQNSQPIFKIGDLVKLKSGSPVMTVDQNVMQTGYQTSYFTGNVTCKWFVETKQERGTFHQDALAKTT